MSPTIHRERGYRFFFFSREEPRMHVHVMCADGESKFWLEPEIEVRRPSIGGMKRWLKMPIPWSVRICSRYRLVY